MTHYTKYNLAASLSLLFILLTSQTKDFCTTRNFSFKSGESMTYKVYYHSKMMDVGAGEAKFSVESEQYNNKPVYHITGTGNTYRSYDWFFKVRDKYESLIDSSTNLPLKFIRNVQEGSYKFYESALFNHKNGTITSTKKVTKIDNCVHDVLSSIYFARNVDYSKYKAGDKIPFQMYIEDKVYDIYIKYLGLETITTSVGKFRCVKFKPLLIKGTLFEGGEKMNVWATDDGNHMPVRVESPITVGNIRADIIKWNNLRNPLTSYLGKK